MLLLGLLLTHPNPATTTPVPPDSLTARETRNLTALALAVGDLKYFYPNRHTARVSWETVLTRAIPAVRRARTDQALATTLDSLLRPLAPASRINIGPGNSLIPASPATAGYFWEHHGLGLDKAGLGLVTGLMRLGGLRYESQIQEASAAEVAAAFPTGQSYTEHLTDSVRLTLPLVLTEAQYRQRLRYRPGRRVRRLRANTPEQRLATTMLTWNVIRHFYPYRAMLDSARWADALTEALPQAARATSETELLAATRRMLARLPDRHVGFVPVTRTGFHISPPPYALQFELVDSAVVVRQVPAELRPLVAPGAVLTHLNGQPLSSLLEDQRLTIPAISPAVARQLATQQLVPTMDARHRAADFTFQDSAGQSRTYGLVIDLRRRPNYKLLRILPHFSVEPLLTDSVATPLLRQPDFRHAVLPFRANTPNNRNCRC